MVSFVSDRGEVEWALVKNTTAQVQAKYVGSLAGFGAAASDFLNYCNPKYGLRSVERTKGPERRSGPFCISRALPAPIAGLARRRPLRPRWRG